MNGQNNLITWFRVNQRVLIELEKITASYYISFSSFVMIDVLYRKDYLTPKEVSEILMISKPATSRRLNILQSHGYVKKFRGDDDDQRVIKLAVTNKGKVMYLKIINSLKKYILLTCEDIQNLEKLLSEVSQLINNA
ncbi:MarR family winged helix-turn-helix transcriptional regulator [Latilactobacillus fragifolii]|uniref:MarR family winged helix-turn-helix transcriptional regulator n=1 Tax=Latilactobacillus fragifolii TaxID=2814244 RepID=UPI001ABB73D7|nr:MarR family transcriptional regulator [Latilactobacillus fragifolii]